MGNGGLRHAHPGSVVVDADSFKVDGADHSLLVGGELLDGGAETLFIGGIGKEGFQTRVLHGVVHAFVDLALQRIVPARLLVIVVVLLTIQVDENLAPIIGDFDKDGFAIGKVIAVRRHSECPFPTRKGHHKGPKNSPFFLTGAFGSS